MLLWIGARFERVEFTHAFLSGDFSQGLSHTTPKFLRPEIPKFLFCAHAYTHTHTEGVVPLWIEVLEWGERFCSDFPLKTFGDIPLIPSRERTGVRVGGCWAKRYKSSIVSAIFFTYRNCWWFQRVFQCFLMWKVTECHGGNCFQNPSTHSVTL